MSAVVPTKRQMEYQDWEFGIFLHFGIRTFYEGHRDWDGKPMTPEAFAPTALDCNQWVKTAKRAGAKYMVLTAKHHDGFANWPSHYTDFSVAHSPWKEGQGDVIRDYTEACRRHGMGVGLYYSPRDWASTVYEDPKAYDDYFVAQVSEILTGYGKVDILWFDGCGSEGHQYDWPRITREIRRMQPEILLFHMGDPDFRWVGNESGIAPVPCWNAVDAAPFSVLSEGEEPVADGALRWLPAECDCRMRDHNWFYSDQDEHTVKSIEELMGLYYYSVGRGCNLLINIGPDRRGLLPDADARRLLQFGREIRRRFSEPLAGLADCRQDGNAWIWEPAEAVLLDHVVAQEDLAEGEHVRRFRVQISPYPYGGAITVHEGLSMGHKAICPFPLVRAKSVRVEILEADGEPRLRTLAFFGAGQ